MPVKTNTTTQAEPEHVLHRHRPIVTMGLGMALFLAIAVLTMASLTPLRDFSLDNNILTLHKRGSSLSTPPSSWPTYKNDEQGLSFRHPESWKVAESTQGGNTLITLQEKINSTSKILIYISEENFLGFEGLPTTSQKLNGYSATYVDSSLFGIKANNQYYTFDAGLSSDSLPVFKEIANSIKIE